MSQPYYITHFGNAKAYIVNKRIPHGGQTEAARFYYDYPNANVEAIALAANDFVNRMNVLELTNDKKS